MSGAGSAAPLRIDPCYLTGEADMEVMLAAGRMAADMMSRRVFDGKRTGWHRPRSGTDAEMELRAGGR